MLFILNTKNFKVSSKNNRFLLEAQGILYETKIISYSNNLHNGDRLLCCGISMGGKRLHEHVRRVSPKRLLRCFKFLCA